MSQNNWISIGGKAQSDLQLLTAQRLATRMASGEFSSTDLDYVKDLRRPLLDSTANLSASKLEKLRRLCQLWDIEFRDVKITSHRKFIGPIIVAAKRIFMPILRMALKDLIRQQRDFNAATISLLAEITNEDTPCALNSKGTIIK